MEPEESDPKVITKAAENAVAKVKASDSPGSQPSKCNIGVQTAFKEITGSNEINNMNANTMSGHMSTSKNFEVIDVTQAQDAANNGQVVIATWINKGGGSGHVALVVLVKHQSRELGMGKSKRHWRLTQCYGYRLRMRTESQPVNYSFGKANRVR
jgi:hypothetical protein